MSITVALRHRTTYQYPGRAELSAQVVRLRPAPHARTPILSYSLTVEPADHFLNWQQDPFGNHLARIVIPEPTDHFSVEVNLVAELVTINPFDFFLEPDAEHVPFTYEPDLLADLAPYLRTDGPWTGELARWLQPVAKRLEDKPTTVNFLLDLTRQLADEIDYEIRYEPGVQPSLTTLDRRAGSCRDSAWLLVEALRQMGMAARFVSGYLVQLTADVAPLEGPAGPAHDFTDLHAWAEVYLPGAGWIGLDPTSGLAAGEGHIPLVATPAPQSAAPITGMSSIVASGFDYSNEVTRVAEAPRSTKPYPEPVWEAITRLGHEVDEALVAGDVRLTMGGEPTFVSATEFEAPEWTTDADGDDKRRKASALADRLKARFGPGGLIQHGTGKWYPGEPLPRWEMNLLWRADGEPIWRDPALLAGPFADLGHDHTTARRLADALAAELGVASEHVLDAYEDPVYGLWRESTIPVDVDPRTADVDDADHRRTLATMLERGLGTPVGSVLPLDRVDDRWRTSPWPLRRSQVFLTPGTSPMGLRLPLDTLPDGADTWPDPVVEPDPFEARPPLPTGAPGGGGWSTPALVAPEPVVIRTALVVEARGGATRVFLPPVARLEWALDLLTAVERAAAATAVPVVIEGYGLPGDPRLNRLSVTPDPGVIEVNVQPTASFAELEALATGLYDDAHQVGLGTEKFHLDGRHTGTGGGNHITLGGPTAADSPLLRNPALLASLVTYWQHHPSLSYAFSGMFVGPTSQAPRVDEARHENLHELEIALHELDRAAPASPWLADRALRHLLTDLTGNTHRAELCIDKLYSPDHSRGRLGLLELRAFEMPPHPRMSVVQALLVRALVAWLWDHPYRKPLIRWGTDLHDRFLLPHYLAADTRAVCDDLRSAGFAFDPEWLEPFFEFRFPRYGTVVAGDTTVELRAAIEPWLVLGEEATGGGTARYVDSSMERLQVKTTGFVADRHHLTVNGRRVPLRPTGRPGEHVAGVRYRAWHPASALHPTIGVHHPLNFEVVDGWTAKAIGGARYHVAHPGGRSYDVLPVNALEAEARRQSRFDDWTLVPQGPSFNQHPGDEPHDGRSLPGPIAARAPRAATSGAGLEPIVVTDTPVVIDQTEVDLDFPVTLDLRTA
ncbi:MAG: transglutaminase family protein [Acidimicrobiales bacterium]